LISCESFNVERVNMKISASLFWVLFVFVFSGCDFDSEAKDARPYLEQRKEFQTNLSRKGPSPQDWENTPLPNHVREIHYQSGDLLLRGWVYIPNDEDTKPHPALLFCHGGFSADIWEIECGGPFLDAGYVVFLPVWRGENGNPGNFELMFGEVDDAVNALKWLSKQPFVDPDQIYMFGHSIGGGISAMVSLMDDVPLRHCGSSGGLYDARTFHGWYREWGPNFCPFNPDDKTECRMRVLEGNLASMKRNHYAYIGTKDVWFHSTAKRMKKENKGIGRLFIEEVPGDHFESLEESVMRYFKVVQETKQKP
ncbi:alpha/beta fold hydrolase, partial [Desulfosarcina sp. OttesenSCG-928-B08]|nr:alpha/beta fold hydrolase [Desulfosarcina sp. OttesenSCG-928-B08]